MQCTSIVDYHECTTPANWNFKNITRPFSIIYYVLGGTAFYTLDGKEKPFLKHHLYILPQNTVFSLREDPKDKFVSLYVHAFTSPAINSLVEIDVSTDPFIGETLTLMRRYSKTTDTIYIKNLVNMLLSYVFELNSDSSIPLHAMIKEYVEENFIKVFKHGTISEKFNYSRSHLTRIFKEKYNITPKQYAEQLILKETVLLLNKGFSIAKIADILDFSSPENLSRFFKKCYGYSPSKYRKYFQGSTV